jgi:hypothetical protein
MNNQLKRDLQLESIEFRSLAASRELLTAMSPDPETEASIVRLFDSWRNKPISATPLQDLREIVEMLRLRHRNPYRIAGMNTLIRHLGQRHNLADFLEMMREAMRRESTVEQEIALISQLGKWHSIYGWCGQTIVVTSAPNPVSSTSKPKREGVAESLEYPRPLWWISIHVWQPNANAAGFPSGKRFEPELIVEPPHTHPFDFVSMVSVGKMRQSIYRPATGAEGVDPGRYAGVTLQKVDGVWPPHNQNQPTAVEAVEQSVVLSEGDSYFLPYNVIHDVEISANGARETPTITLFMASESLDTADVYMAESMLDYHECNPDILAKAKPMERADWDSKLQLLAEYLRGNKQTLRLQDLVQSETDYAFFHV